MSKVVQYVIKAKLWDPEGTQGDGKGPPSKFIEPNNFADKSKCMIN